MMIRVAMPHDIAGIDAVLRQAFPGPEEADLVTRLHADGDVAISLIAEAGGVVCGTVIFSPMSAPFRALGLAPVAVLPGHQRQGIGAALIHEGIELARVQGWEAVFVLGDPDFYQRFGFLAETAAPFENRYSGPYFMALALGEHGLAVTGGAVEYAPAFATL